MISRVNAVLELLSSTFENDCVKTNTVRPILQQLIENLVSGNKVYADNRRGFLERKHQTTVESRVNARAAVAYILAQMKFIRLQVSK